MAGRLSKRQHAVNTDRTPDGEALSRLVVQVFRLDGALAAVALYALLLLPLSVGVAPLTSCRYCGMVIIAPNMPKPMSTPSTKCWPRPHACTSALLRIMRERKRKPAHWMISSISHDN